jgi:acetoin utilization deacetylase AcuC-like enzyme
MRVFYSDRFLGHSLGQGHPECPERLGVIKNELQKIPNAVFQEPADIPDTELELAHSKEYIRSLKEFSAAGAAFPDNVFSRDTFAISRFAAAAAKDAALNCIDNKEFSFALVRPPGHHAGRDSFAGFCYINNIAFAVRSLQKEKSIGKVMIIDIDYHTGNGTWSIFHDDPSVFYLSFHCDPSTAYPGTGFENENTNHMVNVVMEPGTDDAIYLKRFIAAVQKYSDSFKPDAIAVSAGFDTWHQDPIAGLGIKDSKTYSRIAEAIAGLKLPTFATLEGGYYLPKLGGLVSNFVQPFL